MKIFPTAIAFVTTSLLVVGMSQQAIAAKQPPRKFPHGCREFGYDYKEGLLVLKPVPSTKAPSTKDTKSTCTQEAQAPNEQAQLETPIQTIYLMHNLSSQEILLKTKKSPEHPFTPTQENTIAPNHWAAFAVSESEVAF